MATIKTIPPGKKSMLRPKIAPGSENVSINNNFLSDDRAGERQQNSFHFYFNVSADEEHVTLKIKQGHSEYNLQERSHHYLLFVLARMREQDSINGFDKDNQGWVYMDKFCKMLGMDRPHINIQIYRARQQIKKLLPDFPTDVLVERRQGGLRFGFDEISYK